MRDLQVSKTELDQAKAKYVGDFVIALEQPETVARYALSILTEGLPKDFYTSYLQKINAVTIEDIQRVAQQYFHLNNARIFVTGKGSEVLENLEKAQPLGQALPISFYDKYGLGVDRPNYDAALPEGVTAENIINRYLDAIGGREKAEAVETKKEVASGSMQGMQLEITSKKTNRLQSSTSVSMMGNIMQKQVINKDKGYNETQGQRMEMSAEELAGSLADTAIFAELALDPKELKVLGVADVDGEQAYEVEVKSGKSFFYSVESGLKIKVSETQEIQGDVMTQETLIGDYKAVDGLLFAHKITQSFGPQKIDFISSSIELNVPFGAADFE